MDNLDLFNNDMEEESYSINSKFLTNPFQKPDLSKLNNEQYEAATFQDGPVLVIAGAGSGKTTVIINRLANLVYNGTEPEAILLLTFTNKAANEMLTRAKDMLKSENEINVKANTYHAFCSTMLRKYYRQANISHTFTIMDAGDVVDTINFLKQTYGFGKDKTFPKASELSRFYSDCLNKEYDLFQYLFDLYPDYIEHHASIQYLWNKYNEYKKDHDLMDYDDLLCNFLNLLETREDVAKEISDSFDYIMVDEYQDSNIPQMKILRHLRKFDNKNIMVVGDDFQSIYGFRGAEIENILNFPKQWENCKTIILNQNYRSNQKILDFSNAVTEQAKEKFTKELKGNHTNGIAPVVINIDNQDMEARFILSKIDDFHTSGLPYKKMAAIIRGSNDSIFLEKLLTQYKIPFQKFGGIKFLERSHIKDILAYLKVYVNNKDEISWFRIFQLYPDIGKAYAKEIASGVKTNGISELNNVKYQKRKFGPYLIEITNTLEKLKKMSLKEQIEFLIVYRHSLQETIIKNSRRTETSKVDSLKENDNNLNDSKLLVDMATGYIDAISFLTDITLETPTKEENDDYFNITTVHSAKGLEYDVVFIVNCTDGTFPWDFPAKANTTGAIIQKEKDMEEERRVFYVAITRAKTHLFLCVPKRTFKFGTNEIVKPSRYLTESTKTIQTYRQLNVR